MQPQGQECQDWFGGRLEGVWLLWQSQIGCSLTKPLRSRHPTLVNSSYRPAFEAVKKLETRQQATMA